MGHRMCQLAFNLSQLIMVSVTAYKLPHMRNGWQSAMTLSRCGRVEGLRLLPANSFFIM